MFEKNAGPILYLAGLEVNVVKTEYEGQVKKFMSVLETKDTDGIVIAGGDGTLLEAVTGIMRKEDKSMRQNIPIGVIPLGGTNRFAQLIFGSDKEQVRFILESAMSVVHGLFKKVDVLKIKGDDERTTFALSGLEAGAYRDTAGLIPRYWYFGPLKAKFAYLRTAMKEWPPVFKAKISYIMASEENTKPKPPQKTQPTNSSRSWLSFFYRSKPTPRVFTEDDEYPDEDNEYDEEFITEDMSSVELTLNSTSLQDSDQPIKAVEVGIGPSELSKSEFVSEGWRRNSQKSLKPGCSSNNSLLVKKIKITPEIKENKESWYYIDGEKFEMMPVEIKLLRNRLRFFHNPMQSSVT